MGNTINRIASSLMLASSLILTGCASPEFAIQRADDRFSANKNPVYISQNNRLSAKSLLGGNHVDDRGVYINPYVEQDSTGKTARLGLNIVHKTSSGTFIGNMMRYGTLQSIVFRLDDGSLITLKIENASIASPGVVTYNPMIRSADVEYEEAGSATISQADYRRLAGATALSVRITGTAQAMVYEEKDISPGFLGNLRVFAEQHVK